MTKKKIDEIIKKNKIFLISTHVNPDPDAICSELALAEYLRSLGKQVSIVNEGETVKRLNFFPGAKQIKPLKLIRKMAYDAAFILDCGDLERIGKVRKLIEPSKPLVNIDHHITNDRFGTVNLVNIHLSSTAEVLFDLLKYVGCKMNKNLATNLYCGIMTDTGSFRYENTSSKTHLAVAELLKYNINANDLYNKIYETIPLDDLKGFTQILSRFETYSRGKIVCVELKKKWIGKLSDDFDLRDAIFKFLRSISGVEVIFIMTEIKQGLTRVNFRSLNYVDVAKIAHSFDGGGHQRASGCTLNKNPKETKTILIRKINQVL